MSQRNRNVNIPCVQISQLQRVITMSVMMHASSTKQFVVFFIVVVFFMVVLYPQNRHWEVLRAWWTLHITHADVASYWQSLTGVPVLAPGATLAVASVLQRAVQAYLVAT